MEVGITLSERVVVEIGSTASWSEDDDDDTESEEFEAAGQQVDSPQVLADLLESRGSIRSAAVAAAFRQIDRSEFVPARCRESAFDDAPMRARDGPCVVHLSAPSIYATAIETLELAQGLSFLNVGSGSGYFSALAASILSPSAVHHCIERCPRLAARSRATLAMIPAMRHVTVHSASVFDLDETGSMRYDRVYCGAGALSADARFLARFLKVGGILVGPFEAEDDDLRRRRFRHGHPQSLVRATLVAPDDLRVDQIMPVQFTPLARDDDGPKLVLKGPSWGIDSPDLFPPQFKLLVAILYRAARAPRAPSADHSAIAHALPWHVWAISVLKYLAHDDVEPSSSRRHLLFS
ncbi:hypothetical protein CTAYLR_001149 [Chrysophaeum taylorii]|uniref:Protein-L-isoaspartate(D-aspartate) O-methyltransferase n=1 Tax=Chrysophaeum taylorii TaxID=2483200 RepID=A0AAD7UQ21_9STRA|nr:hypothetical protein CTAYLR_001149 [Chrysophaeum taylorii]